MARRGPHVAFRGVVAYEEGFCAVLVDQDRAAEQLGRARKRVEDFQEMQRTADEPLMCIHSAERVLLLCESEAAICDRAALQLAYEANERIARFRAQLHDLVGDDIMDVISQLLFSPCRHLQSLLQCLPSCCRAGQLAPTLWQSPARIFAIPRMRRLSAMPPSALLTSMHRTGPWHRLGCAWRVPPCDGHAEDDTLRQHGAHAY